MKKGSKFEKFTNIIKKRNFVIALSVAFLTAVTLQVTYASFFTVKTNTNNQTLTTGTLEVVYSDGTSRIVKDSINTEADEEGLQQEAASMLHIQNKGTLNSTFILNIGYDVDNLPDIVKNDDNIDNLLTPLDYIMVAVFERTGGVNEWEQIIGPISIADLPIYSLGTDNNQIRNRYSLMVGNIGNTSSESAAKNYQIKTWVSLKAPQSISNTYFYLNTEVVAEVENAKMNYNISGTVKDTDGNALANAKLSFHNLIGSRLITTDENGAYSLNGIYPGSFSAEACNKSTNDTNGCNPGTYNLDITYDDKKYSGNITVSEGDAYSITSMVTSSITGHDIYVTSAAYGTTIAKILNANNIKKYTDIAELDTISFMPTYEIVGAYDKDIKADIILDLNNSSKYGSSGEFSIEVSE